MSGHIDPIFISVEATAAALGLPKSRVYKLLDAGAIESRYERRRRMVVVASLREFAANLPSTPEDEEEVA